MNNGEQNGIGIKSIKDAATIQEVGVFRESLHRARVENDDNSLSLLGDLYKDDTHFLYELLQNAEDAEATTVKFELFDNCLVLRHNGKVFSLNDVKAITNYGASEKVDEEKIGKFGIGFKSVFSITNNPKIYSGEFSFEIKNYSIPIVVSPLTKVRENFGVSQIVHSSNLAVVEHTIGNGETVFIFEFKRDKDCYNILKERFLVLEEETVMFLKNIKTVTISGLQETYSLTKHYDKNRLSIIKQKNNTNQQKDFLFFSKQSNIRKNFEVSVAFVLSKSGEITNEGSKKLTVFFPTEIDTQLNFYINAPFETKPTREQLKQKSQINTSLLQELLTVYSEALEHISKNNLSTIKFLDMLPTKTSQHTASPIHKYLDYLVGNEYYKEFWKQTHKSIAQIALIPNQLGKLSNAKDVAIANQNCLFELVDSSILEKTCGKKYFASKDVAIDKTANLLKYLQQEHGVLVLDFEDFVKSLTEDILKSQKDGWIMKLYWECLDLSLPVAELKVPLIRTQSSNQVIFVKEPIPNVYLPSNIIDADRQVKRSFVHDEKSMEFFAKLGIGEVDIVATVATKALNKLKNAIARVPFNSDEYALHFETILGVYNEIKTDFDKTNLLINLLANESIVMCGVQQIEFKRPNLCVAATPENQILYNECPNHLVHKFYQRYDSNNIAEFFKVVGVKEWFLFDSFEDQSKLELLYQKEPQAKDSGCVVVNNFKIVDFDTFAKNNFFKKSKILFEHIVNCYELDSRLESVGEWFGETSKIVSVDKSKIVQDIHAFDFVFGDSTKAKIGECTKAEFFAKIGVEISLQQSGKILHALEFLDGSGVQLSEEDKFRLELIKDIPPQVLELVKGVDPQVLQAIKTVPALAIEQFAKAYNTKKAESAQVQNTQVQSQVPPTIGLQKILEYITNNPLEIEYWDGSVVIKDKLDNQMERFNKLKSLPDTNFVDMSKGVAYLYLQSMYLNSPTKVSLQPNQEYDIVVQDGNQTEFVLVKYGADKVELSGLAWEKAIKTHKNPNATRYTLCLVTPKDGKTVIDFVGNPYTEWTNGRVFASPIATSKINKK